MNSRFRIVKGVGVEINGHLHQPPAHLSQASKDWAIGLAELAFNAGQRDQMYQELHDRIVSRKRLDAIVPMIVHDLRDHLAVPPIRVADPLT